MGADISAIKERKHRTHKINPNSLANLRPYVKGQSGNPLGRPRKLTDALDRALTKVITQEVAQAIVDKARAGDVYAFEKIAERLEGKVPQAITAADGGPLMIQVVDIGGKSE